MALRYAPINNNKFRSSDNTMIEKGPLDMVLFLAVFLGDSPRIKELADYYSQ